MRRRTYIAGITMAAAVVVGAATGVTAGVIRNTPDGPSVVTVHGDDRLPSTTAADWVTYAHHVVVVTATAEREIPPTPEEIERGEGVIGRTVTLQVKKVLWSRQDAPKPPQSWDYNAAGWTFTDNDPANRAMMVMEDRPRVEVGHQYIMAIKLEAARCVPGDVPEPARWMGLGEGSEIPFDGDVIGQGENEGETQTAAQARTLLAEDDPNVGLEEQLAGSGDAALTSALSAATPGTPEPGPDPSPVPCA